MTNPTSSHTYFFAHSKKEQVSCQKMTTLLFTMPPQIKQSKLCHQTHGFEILILNNLFKICSSIIEKNSLT